MTEWTVTITYDTPCPPEEECATLLGGPITSVGRSPWSDRLAITAHLHAGPWSLDDVVSAVTTLTLSMLEQAEITDGVYGHAPAVASVEALTPDEQDRRSPEPPSIRSRFVTAAEAAEMLGISARAVRQQTAALGGEMIGEAGWIFPRASVESNAARRREFDIQDADMAEARRLDAGYASFPADDYDPEP